MELPARARHALEWLLAEPEEDGRIETLFKGKPDPARVSALTWDQLADLPNVGRTTIEQINEWLRFHGAAPIPERTSYMPRYTYNRMTGAALSAALDQHQISMRQFCRLTGANEKTVELWLAGLKDIPHWVALANGLLTLPGAFPLALKIAERFIVKEDANNG